MITVINASAAVHVTLQEQRPEKNSGIAEVVGSNPAQSLNFFRSLFLQCYGRICINDRYHVALIAH